MWALRGHQHGVCPKQCALNAKELNWWPGVESITGLVGSKKMLVVVLDCLIIRLNFRRAECISGK